MIPCYINYKEILTLSLKEICPLCSITLSWKSYGMNWLACQFHNVLVVQQSLWLTWHLLIILCIFDGVKWCIWPCYKLNLAWTYCLVLIKNSWWFWALKSNTKYMLLLEKLLKVMLYLLVMKITEVKEIIWAISREKIIWRRLKGIAIIAMTMVMSVTHDPRYMGISNGIRILKNQKVKNLVNVQLVLQILWCW